MINEETHPRIALFVDKNLHHEIVSTLKNYLDFEEGLSKEEILEKIDVCYDENNIPITISMNTIAIIVNDVDNLESCLDVE